MCNSEKKNQIYGAGLNARGVCKSYLSQKENWLPRVCREGELVIAAFLPVSLTKVKKIIQFQVFKRCFNFTPTVSPKGI